MGNREIHFISYEINGFALNHQTKISMKQTLWKTGEALFRLPIIPLYHYSTSKLKPRKKSGFFMPEASTADAANTAETSDAVGATG